MRRAVVLFTLPLLLACQRRLPSVEISLLWQRDYLYIAPADVNGDSTDEFVTVSSGGVLDRLGSDMRTSGKTAWIDRGAFALKSVAGESKEAGIWYTHVRHDSLFLFSSRAGRDLLITCGHDSLPPAGWDGVASGVTLLDVNNDGRLDAVVNVTSGYDARPRGLYALDYATGAPLWTFLTGPCIWEPTFRDIDGDTRVEILCGSQATRNGNVVNGTTDDSTYVFLLGCDGRPRWVRRIGRFSSIAHAAFASSSDGRPGRVVVYETGSEEENRPGDSAFILDCRTGEVLARRQCGKYTSCGTTATGAGGQIRIILGGSDDTLRVLDDSLRTVRSTGISDGVRQVIAGSFSGRGQDELAVLTNDGHLLLLDTLLRLRAVEPCSTTAISVTLQRVRYAGKDRLLVLDSDGDKRTWLLYDFSPFPLLQRRVPLVLVLVGLGFLLACYAGTLLLLRYRQTRDLRAVVRGLTGQAGVVELDRRGRVRRSNPKGRELLLSAGATESAPLSGPLAPLAGSATAGTASRELPLTLPAGQTILARTTAVKSGLLLTLEDISSVEYMKRMKSWAPLAQKLAHDIKNPLSTIRLKAQQMEEDGVTDARTIQEEVDRLSKMTDGFARLANFEPLKLEPKEINTLVRRVVEEQGLSLRTGLVVKLDLQTGLPLLNLDEEQMASALANLVTNAVAAMPGKGVLTIRTRTVNDGTHVVLEVADTGAGIPEEYRAKLFQPFFTRKQGGTGLGLSIVRKVVEDHHGTVEVESEVGKGSAFSIVLPAGKTIGTWSA